MENKKSHGQAAIESRSGATAGSLKAQAATEVLVLAGFALVFIIPLAFLFLSATNSEMGKTSLLQAKASARSIADNAGEVYLQGAGARKYIVVNYPQGVMGASAGNGVVALTFYDGGRQQDIVASTFANITGNLSGKRTAGLQTIRLENVGGYVVNVTYAK